jgi:hypothetical protein
MFNPTSKSINSILNIFKQLARILPVINDHEALNDTFVHAMIKTFDDDAINCWETFHEDNKSSIDLALDLKKSVAARSSKPSSACDAKNKRTGFRSEA